MDTKKIFALLLTLSIYAVGSAGAVNNDTNVTVTVSPTDTLTYTPVVNYTDQPTQTTENPINQPQETSAYSEEAINTPESPPDTGKVDPTDQAPVKSPGVSAISALFIIALIAYKFRKR